MTASLQGPGAMSGGGRMPGGEALASATPSGLHGQLKLEGTLQGFGDVLIDAAIDGEVITDGVLTIAGTGSVTGEVRAKAVIVCGRIQGNVYADEHCELRAQSAVEGDICAGSLAIEDGAAFLGRSAVGAGRQAADRDAGEAASA